ncbi:MAG: hypothetical protein HYT85_16260 [candidate division NC10 bacterium]|nr:hypothetical protein [candidate division NC10 bacterium]
MTRHRTLVLTGSLILGLGLAAPALAQSVDDRLSNQAERISEGIRDGSLTAREAARLEREESAIAREEQRFTADGNLSALERAKLERDLNRASRDIWRERHDHQGAMAPTPWVDGRLQNEQRRIDAGVADGSLTAREARRLQAGENRIAAEEQRFKSDGAFTPRERQKTLHDENRLSRQIYRQRHDGQRRR